MRRGPRFASAISLVGETAFLLLGEERLPFSAGLQKTVASGGTRGSAIGYGAPRESRLFIPRGETADRLRRGDIVEIGGERYRLGEINGVRLGAELLYRVAAVFEEGGETDGQHPGTEGSGS